MASVFSKIRQAYSLIKHIDLDQLGHIASKVDLGAVMETVGKMDDKQLARLMKQLDGDTHKDRPLPPIEGDFYHVAHALTDEERALQRRV
jgi:glutaryl-CoA dehydrogenase